MRLWIAEGSTEQELSEGLKLDYIIWHNVRLDIEKIQPWPSDTGLVTKLVTVKPLTSEQLARLNDLALEHRDEFRN